MLRTSLTRALRLALPSALARRSARGKWGVVEAIVLLAALSSAVHRALADNGNGTTGAVEGKVSVANRERSYVTGAKVTANGPVTVETETDANGKYMFVSVPPGTYTVKATFSGLEAIQTISVVANRRAEISLELRPPAVKTSVTVTASESAAKVPAPTEIITQKTLRDAPNVNERLENLLPLVPGVVRGPDGRVNLKGTRNTQSGTLVNSANVSDPATGNSAISLPIDVVSSVKVISNPYDPEYGKITGAVSTVETKTGDDQHYHYSVQNVLPRLRDRDGSIVGIEAATPRTTLTGPIIKDHSAFTQSLEYRFVRTPVNSLPPLQRDTKLEGFNSFTQVDLTLNSKQTATVSFALYPQKLAYMGLNTFTPQPSTADFHQRGYQLYGQHRYVVGTESVLISQLSYKPYDADVTAQNDDLYQLLVDTTQGGFFNRLARRTTRFDWQESYQFSPRQLWGSHQVKVGLDYAHSTYDGREIFLPVEIIGTSGSPIERISFTQPTSFGTHQNETAWFIADQWSPSRRLTFNVGIRFDSDTVTSSTHAAPRVGFLFALTNDGKTLFKGGVGMFYDRVPLMLPVFESMPDRTITTLDTSGQVLTSTFYQNRITGRLQNPRSTSWNVAVERQVLPNLSVRIGYEQRNTARDFVVSPSPGVNSCLIALSNGGSDSYREYQIAGRYQLRRSTLNGSYTRSRAYGDLNDPMLFFGNYSQAVIQPDTRARLSFDAPNRTLFWADIAGPWKLTLIPVFDVHTGFPYSAENEFRDYIGPRNIRRFPQLSSLDLQVSRPFSLSIEKRHFKVRAGFGVFNVFNHFNPRDVQNNLDSRNFGDFFNDAWREYRGKFVFEF